MALVFACIITLSNGWESFVGGLARDGHWKVFVVSYIPIPNFFVMVVGYKVVMKSEVVRAADADLYGGKQRIDEEEMEWLAEEARRKGGVLEGRFARLYRVTLGNFF